MSTTNEAAGETPDASLDTDSASRNIEHELIEVRKAFAPLFKGLTIAVVALIVVAVSAMFYVLFVTDLHVAEKALVVQLIQVGLGMILGYASVFLGVVMSWLGITAAFSTEMETTTVGASGKLSMQSAGPGFALLVGGMILIAVALYKPIHYTEEVNDPSVLVQPTGSTPG